MRKLGNLILKVLLMLAIIWFIILNTDGCSKKDDARTHWAKSNID